MKVLVIGAAGRIAQWTIPLLPKFFSLKLADRNEGEVHGHQIHAMDITNYSSVLEGMRGMDAVLHLAIASSRELVSDRIAFGADQGEEYLCFNQASIDVNVRGTYHVFEAARQAGVMRVVYGSSLVVLLGHPRGEGLHDTLPALPANFYGVTKLWGEQLGEFFARRHGLTVYSLRFGTPHPQPDHANYKIWMNRPAGENSSVTFKDMAGAIECALTVSDGPAFGAYSIVSAAENSRYDCSKALEIGWKSQCLCKDRGLVTELPC